MQVKADVMMKQKTGDNGMKHWESQRRLAEAVRHACGKAAQEAYESAGISGVCEEGRWECAISAIRSLDLEVVINAVQDNK